MFMNTEPRLGHIDRLEWGWILTAGLLIILAAALPYIIGYRTSTADQVFSGVIFNRSDTAVHHASMHLGAQGAWAYRLRFTSEPQSGAYIKMGYILLGQFTRLLPFQGPMSVPVIKVHRIAD